MSTPFKMKGWSGSPIRQNPKPNLRASLQNIQKSISNTLKGVGTNIRKHVKPQSKSSGFGLTSAEKAQAKKHGMSQYQWKTDRNKSGTRANRYARDNKLGKYAIEEEVVNDFGGQYGDGDSKSVEDIVSTVESDPNVNVIKGYESDWVTRKGDPWSYKKTDKGYQTKKGEDGTVIDVFNKNSTAYQSIAEKVFDAGGPVEERSYKKGSKENPHKDTPGVKTGDAKEGEYYKNRSSQLVYLFKDGKYIEQ